LCANLLEYIYYTEIYKASDNSGVDNSGGAQGVDLLYGGGGGPLKSTIFYMNYISFHTLNARALSINV
jgi:hypothetical protein